MCICSQELVVMVATEESYCACAVWKPLCIVVRVFALVTCSLTSHIIFDVATANCSIYCTPFDLTILLCPYPCMLKWVWLMSSDIDTHTACSTIHKTLYWAWYLVLKLRIAIQDLYCVGGWTTYVTNCSEHLKCGQMHLYRSYVIQWNPSILCPV